MKLTGHKTEADYRRYAIVCEADLTEGLKKLAVLELSLRETVEFSHNFWNFESKTSNYAGNYGGGGVYFSPVSWCLVVVQLSSPMPCPH
jgi:hypothetical protein